MNLLKTSTNLVVIEPNDPKFEDITIALQPAKTISVRTATYENYKVKIINQTNNVEKLITDIIAVKKGNDLVVTSADESKVIFRGFYTSCDTDDACTVTLGGGEDGVTITPDSPIGEKLSDGSFMVYTYADSGVLADMLSEVDGETLGVSDLPEGTVSYVPTEDEESNDEGTNWWLVAGGVVLAAVAIKAFSDNNDSDTKPADTSTPVFPDGASTTVTVDENAAISVVVYDAQATDNSGAADANITYTLTGADAAAFNIDAATGVVTLKASADYETKTSYEINVIATDPASNAATQAVTVNVTDLADTNTVSGSIVLGPLVADHGLQVELYQADGTTLLTTAEVASNGTYTAAIGSYTGVIIAKVTDANGGTDYADEASGNSLDLSDSASFTLLAVIDATAGGDVTAYITPLTTLAAQQAGLSASGKVPSSGDLTTTLVNNANQGVANIFGLTNGDVVKDLPDAVINPDGTSATTVNTYGKILAAFSGVDQFSGGVAETIKSLKDKIIGSGSDLSLSEEGQQLVVDGASNTQANNDQINNNLAEDVKKAIVPDGSSVIVDILPPEIAIDAIAVDKIINLNEITAEITGTVEAGSTVVLSIAGNNRDATVVTTATDTTWSYTLTAADITAMGQGAETITATATDRASNDKSVSQDITLDTLLPTIAIDVIAVDNIINASEVTAAITGTVEAGSSVTLSIAGNNRDATVVTTETGTTWSYTLTAADITAMGEGAETLTATATDLAGNKSTASQEITLDTILPAIAIDVIATDNIINASEQTAAITGTVEAGSTVSLNIAGNDRTATVVTTATGTTWSYTLIAADITAMGQGAETITATATDLAGNDKSATQDIIVDTLFSAITIAPITGDNIINSNEVTAAITGTVETGSTVVLSLGSNDSVATVATGTGSVTTWSYTLTPADITAIGQGAKTITATATDPAGNESTANQDITLDTVLPAVTIDVIAVDNIINGNEQAAVITGTVEADSTVMLSLAGNNRVTTVTGTTWSYRLTADDIIAMGEGAKTVTATATDLAGNDKSVSQDITLDTLPPVITIAPIAVDNIINASEQAAVITGTVEPSGTVVLNIAGNSRTATVTDTTWSYTLIAADINAMGQGAETITATATDLAGNKSMVNQDITLDTLPPTIAINVIAGDNVINANEVAAVITGTVEADSSVMLSLAGNNRVVTVTGTTWSYTLTPTDITAMGEGAKTITATATDLAGNTSMANQDITIDTIFSAITIAPIAVDNVINANEQTAAITGTVEAGSTVSLSIGGNNRTATVTDSTWSYTLTSVDITAMGQGAETITATATDLAGNTSMATQDITLDTLAPTIAIDTIAGDDIINANEQAAVITGTVEADSTVMLSLAGNNRVTTVTGTTWSYTLTPTDIAAMGEGDKTITATATDLAGNDKSVTQDITLDTLPPTIAINVIAGDNILNVSEQTADITGTVEAGSTVMLSIAGNNRTATVTDSTWSYTLIAADINAMGQGAETLTATATDPAGNTSMATQDITLDTVLPTIAIDAIATDNTINANEVTLPITGTVEAGSTVSLNIAGNSRTANVVTTATGTTWSYTLIPEDIAAMGEGAETITATATDMAGNTSTANQDITVDTLFSAITIAPITGDNILNANEQTADITGTVEVGSTVSLSIAGNNRVANVAASTGTTTTWSYTLTPVDIAAMGQGAETITATATKVSGNTSVDTQTITLDTLLPAITIDVIAGDDIINANEQTADITGTVEAGSTVSLNIAGNNRTANVVTTATGTTWSYTLTSDDITAMGQGAETITATATDPAGNEGTANQDITLDTLFSAITIADIAVDNVINASEQTADITGTVEAGSTVSLSIAGNTRTANVVTTVAGTTWSYTLIPEDINAMGQGAETITATATDPAGNTSMATQDITLDTLLPAITIDVIAADNVINANEVTADITGTVEAGSTVMLSLAGNNRVATVVTTMAGTTWSYTLTPTDITAMGEGDKTIIATATDTAGNTSTANQDITLDTQPPAITIAAIAVDNVINASEQTADITGTVEAGSSVMLNIAGNTRTAAVTNTTWSYTLIAADIAAMGQGAETITATATDPAGNTSMATQDITLDTLLAAITIDVIATDNVINANEVTADITGTVEAGVTSVSLSLAGNNRVAAVTSSGTWSYTLTPTDIAAMGEGDKTIIATATDPAGNTSTANQDITLDTLPPAITIAAIAVDNIINASEQTADITGTVEAGSSVKLMIAGTERDVTMGSGGATWSYTLIAADIAAMGEGAETITATATDPAGNEATASQDITVDTVLPTITIDTIAGDNVINANEITADITGTVEAGVTSVSLNIAGNNRNATVVTNVSGSGATWSYTLIPEDIIAMGEGAETITATATDPAGNENTASQDITLDTLFSAITIDAIAVDNILNASEQTADITGTIDADSTVMLNIAGNTRVANVAASTGTTTTWSYTLTPADIAAMGQGAETITATATDTAGNTSTATQDITVDTVLPTITIAAIAIDNVINASEQTAPITGTVEAGITAVSLSIGGNNRTATVTNTTWSYTLTSDDIIAMGEGAETITATATDTAGNEGTASQDITVDTVLPTVTIDTIAGDDILNASEQTAPITGTVEAGVTAVSLSIGGNNRTATVTNTTWSYTLTSDDILAMGEGAETITATATDTAGNTSMASQDITVDTVLPTVTIDTIAGDDILNASEQTAPITGTVEAGSRVKLMIAGTERDVTMGSGGATWSYTLIAADINAMGEGAETITATATDTAGNTSTASQDITVDTVLPTITIDTIAGNNIIDSNEQTAAITGTVEAGSSVKLMIAGTERDVTMGNGGATWSYTLIAADIAAMGEGAETITATATDVAGNEGTASQDITIDTVLPTIAIDTIASDNIIDSSEINATITGTVDAGSTVVLNLGGNNRNVTMDTNTTWSYTLTDEDILAMGQGAETLTATATDAVGNESTASQDFTVDTLLDDIAGDNILNVNEIATVITGAVEAGSTVSLSIAGTTRDATVATTAMGTRWSYTLTPEDIDAMGQGAETITVTATNSAGIQSTATQDITLDTLLPPVMINPIAVDNIINSNEVTAQITGTVKAGGTVILSIGGEQRATTAVTDTTWSYTLIADDITNMGQGAETITATATDLAGNTNTATQDITLDTAAAAITTTATFNGVSDESTDDTTPMLTGTLDAVLTTGQVLAVYDGDTRIGQASVPSGSTNWNYTPSALNALTTGSHSFTVRVENTATGQHAPESTAHVVNVTTSISMTATDNVGVVTGEIISAPAGIRYILLKQTGDSSHYLHVNEVQVMSNGENVALNKTVTAGPYTTYTDFIPSGVTDGSLQPVTGDAYASNIPTDDNWLLVDLGAFFTIDSVNLVAFSTNAGQIAHIGDVDVFASSQDFSSQTYAQLTANTNAINLGGTGPTPTYETSLTAIVNKITDDGTPTLSGSLTTALGAGEELAIYDGTTKLGVATINVDKSWSFTPSTDLPSGVHTFTAVIQAVNETTLANAHVTSDSIDITIDASVTPPTQTATITMVSDDVSINGSAVVALAAGATTDDTTPTLTGTLDAVLTSGQVLAVYDGSTRIGEATITGATNTDWTYTPSELEAGSHRFTAQVESLVSGQQGTASNAHEVNVNSGISMTITDDVGAATGEVTLVARYILLKQTGASNNNLYVNEIEVMSNGFNVALNKTVTAGPYTPHTGWIPSGVTDGSRLVTSTDAYASSVPSDDNWLLVDLGASFTIDSVNLYAFNPVAPNEIALIRDVDIFASKENFSNQTYTQLMANTSAFNLGGTGPAPVYKTSLTTTGTGTGTTDDTTPTLSGSLTTVLGTGEELAIYDGTTKIGEAIVNVDKSWTFTPTLANALADGSSHTFRAVIQATGVTNIADGRVISAPSSITIDVSVPVAPTQIATIDAVSDDDSTNGSVVVDLVSTGVSGVSTDDTTPTLTGTLTAVLTSSQVLAVYDGNTKVGEANVTGTPATDWTYTPNAANALTAGSHSFTARVEDSATGLQAPASNAHVVNVNTGISMMVTDNVGAVMGEVTSGVRYILLKQTGDSNNPLWVGEVEVWSNGSNVALHKTVTAGNDRGGIDFLPSGATDGSYIEAPSHAYAADYINTTDNWLQVDLGAYYSIDSVNLVGLGLRSNTIVNIRNVDVFASNHDMSSQSYAELTADPNAINLGGTGAAPVHQTSLTTPILNSTDDTTPTLSGVLTTALAAGEELAIYDGTTKMGIVTVNFDKSWTFTPSALLHGTSHTFTAVIQAAGVTDIAEGRVISASSGITIDTSVTVPAQTVTIVAVSDNVSTNGSATGDLVSTGVSTDDTTPTLTGTLSGALTSGQVLAVYDGATKIGEATITGATDTDWTYTPSELEAGSHSFTAQVENQISGQHSTPSAAHEVNVNTDDMIMTVTDDTGVVTRDMTSQARYILLKQTGATNQQIGIAEVEVMSNGSNVALHKTVTVSAIGQNGFRESGVTNGIFTPIWNSNTYITYNSTDDAWVLIDLGAYYSIDSVNIFGLTGSFGAHKSIDADVFASTQDFSSQTYAELLVNPSATNLGNTVTTAANIETTLTTAINSITYDTTPTLSGSLTTALIAGEELAIYNGTTKLGVAIVNANKSWSYTHGTDLTDGSYAFTTVIQAISATDITSGRVIGDIFSILIDTSVPTQTATIVTVGDNVSTNGSTVVDLATDVTTDDTTPTLTGTLDAALTGREVLVVYDGDIKLGNATITGTNWTYTPSELEAGSHSFTARVESSIRGIKGAENGAHVVNVNNGISITVTDDAGVVMGEVASGAITDDNTLTLSGVLTTALGGGEELAIYDNGVFVSVVNLPTVGQPWSFTSGVLADGLHTLTAVIQNISETNISNGRVISDSSSITIDSSTDVPAQTATIETVIDDVSINGSVVGALSANEAANVTTDDTTPTLTGTLSAALTSSQVLAIYDGDTKVGEATVNNTTWTYTPSESSELLAGSHSFTAQVENSANGLKGSASNAQVINVNTDFSMTLTDNAGAITEDFTPLPGVRYILLKQTGDSTNQLFVNEVQVWSNGSNVALNKAVTAGPYTTHRGWIPSGVTDGSLAVTAADAYASDKNTDDNWLLIDLGAFYSVDSVNLYAFGPTNIAEIPLISNVDVFASHQDFSSQTYAQLTANPDAVNLGGTGPAAAYKTTLTTAIHDTDDNTPTLSGVLTAALIVGEELAIYDGTTKLGLATVSYADNSWTFTPEVALSDGSYRLTAVIQSIGNTHITNGRVISGSINIMVDSSVPAQIVTIMTVSDNVNTNGSAVGALATSATTDDTTPSLSGTVSGGLIGSQVLVVYDGAIRLGQADVISDTWSYTPSESNPLTTGSHSFTARVESPLSGLNGPESTAFVVNVNTLEFVSAYDDVGNVNTNILSLDDLLTDDANPELSGKLAATLATDEVLAIYDGDIRLGEATLNTLANGSVFWHYTITSTLGEGSHTLNVVVENTSAQGVALLTVSKTIIVDTSASAVPTATAIISTITDDVGTNTGSVADGTSTDDTRLTLAGIIENGAVLNNGEGLFVYDGTNQLGQAEVSGSVWSFTPSDDLALGEHNFTVKVVNTLTGLSGSASASFAVLEQSVNITSILVDTGSSGGGTSNLLSSASSSTVYTDDTTPILSGTLAAALAANEIIAVYDSGTKLGNATIVTASNGDVTWSYSPAASSGLREGEHTFTMQVENTAAPGVAVIAPVVTVIAINNAITPSQVVTITKATDDVGNIQGEVSTGSSTDDITPMLTGSLDSKLEIDQQISVYDAATYVGVATIDAADPLVWTFTSATELSLGSHSFTAKVVSNQTNAEGAASTVFEVNVQALTFDSVNTVSSDTTPTVSGTLGDATIGSNEQLAVYDGITYLGNAVISGTGTNTTWSFTPSSALSLSNGSHTFTVQIEEASSNVARLSASTTVVIDETPVTKTATILATNNPAGSDDITLTGTLSGAIPANQELRVFDGATHIGTAVVTNTTWTFVANAQGVGSHNYTVKVSSTDGGLSGTASTAFSYRVTGTAPSQTVMITQVLDNTGSITGDLVSMASDTQTDASQAVFKGTLSGILAAGETLDVFSNGTLMGNATVVGLNWTYTPTTAIADGMHQITAAVTNTSLATQQGAMSASFTLNLEAIPAAVVTMQVIDDVGALTGNISAGTDTDDLNVSVTGTVTDFVEGGVVQVYDGDTLLGNLLGNATIGNTVNGVTTWSYTPEEAFVPGSSHTFEALYVNAAGASNSANKASTAFNVTATDTTFSAIATTDPISGMAVQTFSLESNAMNQTLDFSGAHPDINVVNIAGSGANTVKIDLDDVLQSGINLFNDANGWAGLVGAGKHQVVVNGDADDTVLLDTVAEAGSWTSAGTTTNSGHTYLVYNNADGVSQVLIEQDLNRDGAIL